MDPEAVTIESAHPADPQAQEILRRYMRDVVGRYHRRPVDEAELDAAVLEEPSDDLAPPTGRLWIACAGGPAIGCVGLRLLGGDVGEVTRLFVTEPWRRRGLGARLMAELEAFAHASGLGLLRLDTRSDLTEARRLYARIGYREVEPFKDASYSDRWFVRRLDRS